MKLFSTYLAVLVSLSILLSTGWTQSGSAIVGDGILSPVAAGTQNPADLQSQGPTKLFLPIAKLPQRFAPRVNMPYFEGGVQFPETSIFWFGRVNSVENYADVRVGYNQSELYIHIAVFDRHLWYDPSASKDKMTAYDAVTIYLNSGGNTGGSPDSGVFQLIGQLNWTEDRSKYQAAYQGNGSGWVAAAIPFTSKTIWRGNSPNDNGSDDRGWAITFYIPFSSLGLSGPPAQGTAWGLGLSLHDRDDAVGMPIPDQNWPPGMSSSAPVTWGQLAFGLPAYSPSSTAPAGTVKIRHGLDGAIVRDGEVGGDNICSVNLKSYFTEWGENKNPGSEKNADLNIQNQHDVGDWPCFSKAYLSFPLDLVPKDKKIISATLTLHLYANAGGGDWGTPHPSLIQVATTAQDFDEATLTWNNAPLALENISRAWVYPLESAPDWPGKPYTWEISQAVVNAYAVGQPLRLVLYSMDGNYDSGKYFVSSDMADWNRRGRPTVDILWGEP